MHSSKSTISLAAAAVLTLALAAPVAAGPPEILAEGLDGPRGVDIGQDGAIYVAETGVGGDQCPMGEAGTCFGATGAITRIADGASERIIEGLPSAANAEGSFGVSDLIALDDGSFLVVVNLGGDPAMREGDNAYGYLASVSADGVLTPLADVAGFEATDDPDGGVVPDSNPHSLALSDAGTLVADAGGNDLLLVDDDGSVSLAALFPPTVHEYPAEVVAAMQAAQGEGGPAAEEMPEFVPIPVEAVPTSVIVGPDGAYYVGELTGGPFPAGGASVYRIEAGGEPEIYATGFSSIMDLDFAIDGTLYVAELVHDGLMPVFLGEAPPVGAIMAVPPGGGEPVLVATGDDLMALGGLAVADDGSLIVTTNTIMPGAGAVVRVDPR